MIHRDMESLSPEAKALFTQFLRELDYKGLRYYVVETYRDEATQQAYYAQGRTSLDVVNNLRKLAGLYLLSEGENRNRITECDGIKVLSKHQSGRAMDLVPVTEKGSLNWNASTEEWLAVATVGEALGLVWGGRWGQVGNKLGWDKPHWNLA